MCRLVDCVTNRVVATFLVAALAGGAAWGTYEWMKQKPHSEPVAKAEDPIPETKPEPQAKPKSDHPPIAALRERMLAEFHGSTTNTFASIPGFGMERMTPLYKKVPFEIPYFSTGDLEAAENPKTTPKLLQEALAKTHQQFEKFTPAPAADKKNEGRFFGGGTDGWGKPFNDAISWGLQLRMLDLVGLTDREAPKVHVGGQAFELARLGQEESKDLNDKLKTLAGKDANLFGFFGRGLDPKVAQELGIKHQGHMNLVEGKAKAEAPLTTRGLDMFESAGMQELLTGKDVYLRTKDNVVRMLGALRATEQCIKCHTETKQGELLGAFSYAFVDTSGHIRQSLNQGLKKK